MRTSGPQLRLNLGKKSGIICPEAMLKEEQNSKLLRPIPIVSSYRRAELPPVPEQSLTSPHTQTCNFKLGRNALRFLYRLVFFPSEAMILNLGSLKS